MAKRLEDNSFEPGIIYELRACINNEWHPFYVGETYRPERRETEHRALARFDDTRVVYDFIRTLNTEGVEWRLFPVAEYGAEGPGDLEDENIMRCILDGVNLMNMRKGDYIWLAAKQAQAADMRANGFTSYRKYREWQSELEMEKVRKQNDLRRFVSKTLEPIKKAQKDEKARKQQKIHNKIKQLRALILDFENDANRQGFVRQLRDELAGLEREVEANHE